MQCPAGSHKVVLDALCTHLTVTFAVQALLMNVGNLPVADLVLVCQQQRESDSMVLFLRAVTAAGFILESDNLLAYLRCLTDSNER